MKADKLNNSKRNRKNKISFDEEVISKDQAEKLLAEQGLNPINQTRHQQRNDDSEFKTKKKNKKRKVPDKTSETVEKVKPKKRKTLENQMINDKTKEKKDIEEASEEIESIQETEINPPQKESRRAQKRKKHVELVEQKKLNTELELQQKALNYLSKWKYSRSDWKFEKLKQVWLQQNLFDASKIPDEFWETTVAYFSGAKGYSHQAALDEALKIIDNENEENLEEEYQIKLKRARSIIQNLQ